MLFAIILSFLQLVSTSDRNAIFKASKKQADFYIRNIEKGQNIEENLWALTLLGSEKDSIRIYIEERSKSSKSLKLFRDFEDSFQAQLQKVVMRVGSTDLLIPLLLTKENIEEREKTFQQFKSQYTLKYPTSIRYDELIKSIINKEKINAEVLPNKKFYLPHFFLLFDINYDIYLSSKYIEDISNNWSIPDKSKTNNRLSSIIKEATYFRSLYITSNYSTTSKVYNRFSLQNYFPNSSLKLSLYRYLDYSMYKLGAYDKSLYIVRNFSIPLTEYLGKDLLKLKIKFSQAVNLYSIGKIKSSEILYKEMLKEVNNNNLSFPKSSIYNNLALAYHKLGQYDDYLDLQFSALKKAKESDNYSHQFQILNNLFVFYRESNDLNKAFSYLQEAQNIAQQKGNIEDIGKLYISMGSFYRKFENNFYKAHKYFQKAKKQIELKNNTKLYIDLLVEQADTYEMQNKFEKALEKHDEITSIISSDNPKYLDAIINKALINLKMNNLKRAGSLINEYNSKDLSILDFEEIIKAKTVEADYLQRKGQIAEALDILDPALDQVVVRAQSSGDLQTGFWQVEEEYLDAFELAVSILIDQNREDEAVKKLDLLKTINNASLYQNPLVKSSVLNESELTQYKQLTDQLDAIRKKLLTAPESKQFALQQTISQLNAKKRKLDRKLSSKSEKQELSIRRIQNQLSSRELILHVTELKNKYYLVKIGRTDITMKKVELDSTARGKLSKAVEQVATNKTDLTKLFEITELLGVNKLPDHIQKVTVIPDSYLYQLPIDILPLHKPSHSQSFGATTYFVEHYKTQYLTSLDELIRSPETKAKDNSIDFVGYGISNFSGYNNKSLVPLPFAETEVRTIADHLSELSSVQTFVNDKSTKRTFTETAPHAEILHMATHSSVSDRDPMFSTIYMSNSPVTPDSSFEDRIFAYELFELNLNNEMIMLNSCESGTGPYIQGTGIMGISRALQYAGANSLVLNLWSVNDMMASDFAIYFYAQLNQGKSKAEALRATKQYFLQSKNANPHYWGPYMLIGNADPIVYPNRSKNIAVAGIFVFYFLLMAGLSYLYNKGVIFRKY